jgi:hypothetical protein
MLDPVSTLVCLCTAFYPHPVFQPLAGFLTLLLFLPYSPTLHTLLSAAAAGLLAPAAAAAVLHQQQPPGAAAGCAGHGGHRALRVTGR